jgi:hypothetical protein
VTVREAAPETELEIDLEVDRSVPAGEPSTWKPFFAWSASIYLVSVLALLARLLRATDGHLVYVLDDPAIHLSVAQNLIHHGTWGVAAGHFQSASSAPVWTVLEALALGVAPGARDAIPLLLNVIPGIWLLWVIAHNQSVLRPSIRRPLHLAGTVAAVVAVLYLPALAFAGMEHTLHAVLIVIVVLLFQRRETGRSDRWPRWLPFALLAVATLTRFETAFVAAGLGLGVMLQSLERFAPSGRALPWRRQARETALIGLASGVPLACFAIWNHAMGQGLLPNSVLDKSQLTGVDFVSPFGFQTIGTHLIQDPLVAATGFLGVGYLAFCRVGRNRCVPMAAVLAVAVPLQVVFAQIGWFDRYQNYLIVLGFVALLQIVAEARDVAGAVSPSPSQRPRYGRAVAGLLVLAVFLVPMKVFSTEHVASEAQDTYEQRYQVARFLARYYQGQSIATGELGYVSMLHRGPVTDLLGLGDYEVLRARQQGKYGPAYWADLVKRRKTSVVAIYPSTIQLSQIPPNWISVGNWTLHGQLLSAYSSTFEFWSPTPEGVKPLEAHLREFAKQLPPRETLDINSLAEYRANQMLAKQGH